MQRKILSVISATVWISISEFVRNTFLLHDYWIEHYKKIGIAFPEQSINGAIWSLWSLAFAIAIYFIAEKFSLIKTFLLSWFVGFVFMWLVIGNLGVLPFGILPIAVPLSLLESFIASLIIKKLNNFI